MMELEELLAKLDFSDTDVVAASLEQPSLFMEAARFRTRKMRLKARAEMLLNAILAEESLRLRKRAVIRGEKLTEKLIETTLDTRSVVKDARQRFNLAREGEEYSKLLVEAFQMRRDVCKIISQLMVGEMQMTGREAMATVNKQQLEQVRERLKKKYPGKKP